MPEHDPRLDAVAQALEEKIKAHTLLDDLVPRPPWGSQAARFGATVHDLAQVALDTLDALPPDTSRYGSGMVVTATSADGEDHRSNDCIVNDCWCDCHQGNPIPAGTYITIRLDERRPVGIGYRVQIQELDHEL